MKEIRLTQSLFSKNEIMTTQVDDEDFEWASQWNWYAVKPKNTWYAHRIDPVRGNVLLHREIMKTPDDQVVDHQNRNGLDNQKNNLHNCSQSLNIQRMKAYDGYRGVCWHKVRQKWISQLGYKGARKYLGLFIDPIKAAKAYDKAALQYFGEFAALNFPEQKENPTQGGQLKEA